MLKRSKHKKTSLLRIGLLGVALAIIGVSGGLGMSIQSVFAADPPQTHYCEEANGKFVAQKDPCIAKEVIKCGTPGSANNPCADPALFANCKSVSCNSLVKQYIEPGVKVLTVLMGIVVAISIVVAGITYGAAGSDPSKVAAAKKRLTQAVLTLLGYLFMFSFLQWLLPGGIL